MFNYFLSGINSLSPSSIFVLLREHQWVFPANLITDGLCGIVVRPGSSNAVITRCPIGLDIGINHHGVIFLRSVIIQQLDRQVAEGQALSESVVWRRQGAQESDVELHRAGFHLEDAPTWGTFECELGGAKMFIADVVVVRLPHEFVRLAVHSNQTRPS